MIYIYLTLCMISDPKACRDDTLELDTPNIFECITSAQASLASKYEFDKTVWRITKYRCDSRRISKAF